MLDPRAVESLIAFWADAGVDVAYADAPVERMARGLEALKPKIQATLPPPTPLNAPRSTFAPAAIDAGAVAAARIAAAAANDLVELEAAIAAFDGCDLKRQGARQAVFSRGDPGGPVMVIGEGPGGATRTQGKARPSSGGRASCSTRCLTRPGWRGGFSSPTRCSGGRLETARPPPPSRPPAPPFVERAIALVKPRMIMLAGGASAKHMLKTTDGILSLRGRWFEWKSEDGALGLPALPTLHPAFLLRQPAAKKMAWGDLLMLTERLDRPSRPT